MKRKTAKEILADSFRELAQDMPINKITVKDIIDNCGYSQATFYRQFKDKYDLIAWSYTKDFEAIIDRRKAEELSWRESLENSASYFQQHRQYLANLLTHTSGYDSFIINMTAIHSRIMNKEFDQLTEIQPADERVRAALQIYCYGCVLFSCDWILGKYDLSVKELADVYESAMSEPLRRHFL
ncbi:MAG: TetR/AcrR family transcriptional regulator [Solobacterium sp.]|nr:TetR/AcrR family transcriptional regulator [Solobacterium sp.]